MEHDPRHAPRLRDRALDRLDGLTTGAAALAVIATAGFGSIAAITTHVPGVSAADAGDPLTFGDDTPDVAAPADDSEPRTSTSNTGRIRKVQPQSNAGAVSPPTRSSGHRHASTGGS